VYRTYLVNNDDVYTRRAHMFQSYSNHLKILGARREIRRTFHNKDPKLLVATVENLVPMATWRPGFMHPC